MLERDAAGHPPLTVDAAPQESPCFPTIITLCEQILWAWEGSWAALASLFPTCASWHANPPCLHKLKQALLHYPPMLGVWRSTLVARYIACYMCQDQVRIKGGKL